MMQRDSTRVVSSRRRSICLPRIDGLRPLNAKQQQQSRNHQARQRLFPCLQHRYGIVGAAIEHDVKFCDEATNRI